jgi:tight adherence protein B
MFGFELPTVMMIVLAGFCAGAVAYLFMFNRIDNETKIGRRLEYVKKATVDSSTKLAARDRLAEATKRRKTIQESLKALEEQQRDNNKRIKKPPLKTQLRQAGIKITMERFYLFSFVFALAVAFLVFVIGGPLLAVLGAFVAAGLGVPRWVVSFLRTRRIRMFLDEFPNAIEIIVRAIKSGLPLNDGVRLIASEAKEPVRSEFLRIVESQQLGVSIPEAAGKMKETMPCPESNFFGIVIQIQAQSGGNLAEALGNLSRVLRDRKRMKARVNALSMEAKASAAIIGALPFMVAFLVYMASPNYIMPLFTTTNGHLILAVAGLWMSMGVFVMKKMINFDV